MAFPKRDGTDNGYSLHYWGHQLAAVDVETTGLDPEEHEIIQVAVIPLTDSVEIDKSKKPFSMMLRPGKPENIDPKAMTTHKKNLNDIMKFGMEQFQAADLFEQWFDRLGLAEGKKIIPVGHNFYFDRGFLKEWLGKLTYDYIFHHCARDTMIIAQFVNDKLRYNFHDPLFDRLTLGRLCGRLNIDNPNAHDALSDARVTAEAYRRLLKLYIP